MSAAALAIFTETDRFRVNAHLAWESAGWASAGQDSPRDYLARLIQIHREGRRPEEVNRLPQLNFSVDSTVNDEGSRYALWWPVVEILVQWKGAEAESWVEEWICAGEVALVHIPTQIAAFLDKLIPHVEDARRGNPYVGRSSSLRIVVTALQRAEARMVDDYEVQIVRNLHRALSRRSRERIGSSPAHKALSNAAKSAPDWAVRACVDFLNYSQEDLANDPPALALASESSLSDWLKPEEDSAWTDLQ